MADGSAIEWTHATWNPITGCDEVSPGCDHCYARRLARRLQAMGVTQYANGFEVSFHESVLRKPLRWKRPRLIFVNSMSDLFHPKVPLRADPRAGKPFGIIDVFEVMKAAYWHQFQVLTKRPQRASRIVDKLFWPDNVWVGVSVENSDYLWRVDHLRRLPAAVKFLSLEPLLGPLDTLDLTGIDWVIVGGESGPGARPMDPNWVRAIRDKCVEAGIPFFFKQWGGTNKNRTGRLLDGVEWSQFPRSIVSTRSCPVKWCKSGSRE
ncbi:MAG: hypothetical protein CW346_18810 [Bacillaceae bacterium]|nr:hypothetical protein [Bacillaceae bacterium]